MPNCVAMTKYFSLGWSRPLKRDAIWAWNGAIVFRVPSLCLPLPACRLLRSGLSIVSNVPASFQSFQLLSLSPAFRRSATARSEWLTGWPSNWPSLRLVLFPLLLFVCGCGGKKQLYLRRNQSGRSSRSLSLSLSFLKLKERQFYSATHTLSLSLSLSLGGEQISELASHAFSLCSGRNCKFVIIIDINLEKFWFWENAKF